VSDAAPAFRVDRVQPLILPEGAAVTRHPPREPRLRLPGYLDEFDHRTVGYDAFVRDGTTYVVGPPLLNLTLDAPGEATVVQFGLPGKGFDKTARITLPATDRLRLMVSGQELVGPTGRADWEPFRDRRVLLTMSKDNDLDWIRDWATFHVRFHGVDAVLLYDNGSAYGPEAVVRTLSGIAGLEVAVVVEWPFTYGPQGSGVKVWDSDFCQVGGLEHARQKYLGVAAGVLSADVDELVVSARSIFDITAEHGAVSFPGLWISGVRETTSPGRRWGVRRSRVPDLVYAQFPFREPDVEPCPPKWCVDPRQLPEGAWLGVHRPFGIRPFRTEEASYRHFRGVNTSWKYDRTSERTRPGPEDRDLELRSALESVARGSRRRRAERRPTTP
jgi:hypothetical protein